MSRKIKFHAFQVLFRLFAYLADKSGGWRVFVRPKLLLGSMIVGLGLTVPGHVEAQSQNSTKKASLKLETKIATNSDSIKNDIPPVDIKITMCYQVAEDKPLAFDEQMPQFPGGEQELALYIAKNLKYPSVAIENGVEGTVLIRFEINKMGNVAKIQVMESLNPACDKEAIRIVKSLPVFIPGKQNGVRVCVWYTLPVTFKLPQ